MKPVQRVITISYDVDTIKPTDEVMKAIGYLAVYAMKSDRERDIEHVSILVRADGEINAAYYHPWQRGETYSANKTQYDLDNALVPLKTGRPFVMAGIPGKTGYSFHS
jgi:hypothetical protein